MSNPPPEIPMRFTGGRKTLGRSFLPLVAGVLAIVLSAGAARSAPRLFSHASSDRYWIAEVGPASAEANAGPRTAIRVRQLRSGMPWERVALINGAILDLAHRGQDAVVLMEDTSWMQVWPDGVVTGPRLPDGAVPLRISSDDGALWAIGAVPSSTSRPVEMPERASVSHALGSYLNVNGQWQARAPLPAGVPSDRSLSLAVFDNRPMVAWIAGTGSIGFTHLGRDGRWQPVERLQVDFDVAVLKLLGRAPLPTLWLAPAEGPGVLLARRENWGAPVALPIPAETAAGFTERTIEYFGGNFRLVARAGGKLIEQSYGADGAAVGGPVTLGRLPGPQAAPVNVWSIIVLSVLSMMLASAIFRNEQEALVLIAEQHLQLAPLGRRFTAGLIDLVPVGAALAVALPWRDREEIGEALRSVNTLWWFIGGSAVYLVHTTVTELMTGRTLGKAILGLRVIALTGGRAGVGAVIVRNMLRVLDILPAVPLAMLILFSPLRQRLGDVMAGTVVVSDAPKTADQPTEEQG